MATPSNALPLEPPELAVERGTPSVPAFSVFASRFDVCSGVGDGLVEGDWVGLGPVVGEGDWVGLGLVVGEGDGDELGFGLLLELGLGVGLGLGLGVGVGVDPPVDPPVDGFV